MTYGSPVQILHASVQGRSGVIVPATDGTVYFFDPMGGTKCPLSACPAYQQGAPITGDMVRVIQAQMQAATLVHLAPHTHE